MTEITQRRIKNLCETYKPFIPAEYHHIIDSAETNDISYMNYLLFTVWFCSHLKIQLNTIHFMTFYPSLKHIPFHSFLNNIKCQYNASDYSIDL